MKDLQNNHSGAQMMQLLPEEIQLDVLFRILRFDIKLRHQIQEKYNFDAMNDESNIQDVEFVKFLSESAGGPEQLYESIEALITPEKRRM